MGMSEMPMEFSNKRENRKNALKHVAAGAALLGAGTGGNELLNARVKRRSGAAHPGVIASAARSVSGKPNGFKAATHVPHMAGKMGVRGAQLASLPILAAGLKHAVTGADTKKLDVKEDVVRPAVEYATYQDQMKKGQDRIGKALNESEQSRLSRHKQVGRNVSLASGTLGLAALGLRTPQAARALTNRGVKGLGRLAAKDTKATNLSNTLGVGALGIGSAGSFNYAAQQRLERKKDAVAKAAMQYTAEERRKNRQLATAGVTGALVATIGGSQMHSQAARNNFKARRLAEQGRPKTTVDVNTSSVVPGRERTKLGSSVKGPHAPADNSFRTVEAVEPNRRGVYDIANAMKDEKFDSRVSRIANRGRLLKRGASVAAVGGLATYAGAMGVLDSRHQKKRNELAAQKRAAKQMPVTKGIPTKAWIKRNNLPVNVLDQDGPDHFMVVHTSSRMDGLRQRFHRDELRYATKNQTRLTPVSTKAQAKPTQMQFDFGKSFLKENRDRLSPEAEAGYRHLRAERNENRAAAVGNASVAGLSGWLLSHEARHRPLNKPAAAVTGASALAAGYGALHASRVANRRNKSMNRIEDKARARAAAGLYGPGRGMTPVDTSSSKARKYATVQGMDGASE